MSSEMERCFDRLTAYASESRYQTNSDLAGFPRWMQATETEQRRSPPLQEILAAVEEHTKAHAEHVELVMREQLEVARCLTQVGFTELRHKQGQLREAIEQVKNVLHHVYNYVIPPQHLSACERIKRAIIEQQKQLDVLIAELEYLVELHRNPYYSDPIHPLVDFVVTEQKFPCVCYRGSELEPQELQLSVVHGVTVEFLEPSTITATLEGQYVDHMALENHEQTMAHSGPTANRVAFPLNFVKSVAADPVMISFRATMHMRQLGRPDPLQNALSIDCATSDSFCVINQDRALSDFVGAVKELVTLEAFGNEHLCTWGRFCNAFNRQFLLATKQNLDNPARPLACAHLDYLHDRFFGNANEVTREQAEGFWTWIAGPLLTVAFAPVIQAMWNSGYIQGFMTKEDAVEYVRKAEEGAVILRFSESPQAILSLTVKGNRIKHFRVWNDASGCPNIHGFLGESNCLTEGFSSIFQFNDLSTVWRTIPLETLRAEFA